MDLLCLRVAFTMVVLQPGATTNDKDKRCQRRRHPHEPLSQAFLYFSGPAHDLLSYEPMLTHGLVPMWKFYRLSTVLPCLLCEVFLPPVHEEPPIRLPEAFASVLPLPVGCPSSRSFREQR